jgi:Peptidase family S51
MRPITLLGPQRNQPVIAGAIERMGVDGPLAVVTAGWQEREEEVDELAEHVRRPVTNLRLYGRAEEVFLDHPEIFLAHRQRQDTLKALQRFYRLRLDFVLEPARRLLRRHDRPDLLEKEQESALEAIRALDGHHLRRVRQIHGSFRRRWSGRIRNATASHREELRSVLESSAAVAVAGGHVAVLLNRLRLFEIQSLVEGLPVVAWSAGAMALAEKVVLFHDRPPQGAGNAEILDMGLGLFEGVLPLPHARTRLKLEDPVRVGLLARRFAPAACVTLDEGSWLHRDGGPGEEGGGSPWTAGEGTFRLAADGSLVAA